MDRSVNRIAAITKKKETATLLDLGCGPECDLQKAGFCSAEFYGDVAGAEFSRNGDTVCVVVQKG